MTSEVGLADELAVMVAGRRGRCHSPGPTHPPRLTPALAGQCAELQAHLVSGCDGAGGSARPRSPIRTASPGSPPHYACSPRDSIPPFARASLPSCPLKHPPAHSPSGHHHTCAHSLPATSERPLLVSHRDIHATQYVCPDDLPPRPTFATPPYAFLFRHFVLTGPAPPCPDRPPPTTPINSQATMRATFGTTSSPVRDLTPKPEVQLLHAPSEGHSRPPLSVRSEPSPRSSTSGTPPPAPGATPRTLTSAAAAAPGECSYIIAYSCLLADGPRVRCARKLFAHTVAEGRCWRRGGFAAGQSASTYVSCQRRICAVARARGHFDGLWLDTAAEGPLPSPTEGSREHVTGSIAYLRVAGV